MIYGRGLGNFVIACDLIQFLFRTRLAFVAILGAQIALERRYESTGSLRVGSLPAIETSNLVTTRRLKRRLRRETGISEMRPLMPSGDMGLWRGIRGWEILAKGHEQTSQNI